MEMLVCVLNKPELLDEVLTGLLEAGVGGCTVIESHGMGKFITQDIPIFSGFKSLFTGAHESNYTIFSVVKEKKTINKAMKVVEEIYGGFDKPDTGIMFTLPVSQCLGISGE